MRPIDDLPYIEWTETSGEVKRLYADLWKLDEVLLPAVITQHAVEAAVKITDHYRKDPRTQRVEMFFSGSPLRGDLDDENPGEIRPVSLTYKEYPSNSPVSIGGATRAVSGAIKGALGIKGQVLPRSVSVLQFSQPPKQRLAKALELIDRLQAEGILITVGGTMLRFESMGVANATGNRAPGDGDGGSLSLDLIQLTFTSSDIAVAVPLPLEVRAQSKKSGSNAGDPQAVAPPKKTAAAALLDEVF